MAANSGPGYRRNPEHQVLLEHGPGRVRVVFNGETVAETDDVITVRETGYGPVYYLARSGARMERFERTGHHTHCPFKGDASYFTLSVGGRTAENAVWSYERPYDEVMDLKDRLAFYPDRVDAITTA
jgi:uncharacterized protein (DUF427 family)